MRQVAVAFTSAVLLSGCGLFNTSTPVVMTAKTTLPQSVGATADLKIDLQVIQGCVFFQKVTQLERSPSTLKLQVEGLEKRPCPAIPNAAAYDTIYTDLGNPARTNPFEVFVNGRSVGTVVIK